MNRARLALLPCLLAVLAGTHLQAAPATASDDRTISLIMSDIGFNAETVHVLKAEMEKQGYTLNWMVVNDIIQPNKLVDEHNADANSFQHEPYFDQFVHDHGLNNVVRGFYTTFTPSGIYSRKYKRLEDLPEGATIAVPVDPANNGRALFMLRDHGLLSLREGVPVTKASVRDITANPHRFKFRELDQLMLLRTLDEVDAGFLFSLYAKMGGLDPVKSALALEDVGASPYKGVVAVHRSVVGTAKLAALARAYHSEAVHELLRRKYGDALVFLEPQLATASTASSAVRLLQPHGMTFSSIVSKVREVAPELKRASLETLFMLALTIPLAVLLGTPLGTILFLTRPGSFIDAPRVYLVLNGIVNFVRSFPFLILLIAMVSVTKFVVGSALGTLGAIVPMVVNSIPYFARFVEQNLLEVNRGVIEAAEAMGASRARIIWSVLYAEARSGIAGSITILTVSFLSYSTVAGLVGGGGLGDFAIRYGYYRYETEILIFTVALIILVVQALQFSGNALVRKLDKRL